MGAGLQPAGPRVLLVTRPVHTIGIAEGRLPIGRRMTSCPTWDASCQPEFNNLQAAEQRFWRGIGHLAQLPEGFDVQSGFGREPRGGGEEYRPNVRIGLSRGPSAVLGGVYTRAWRWWLPLPVAWAGMPVDAKASPGSRALSFTPRANSSVHLVHRHRFFATFRYPCWRVSGGQTPDPSF